MTRYASINDLRRNLSPDVADESAAALAALREEMAQEIAAYLQPQRTAERALLDNAGSLGGAVPLEHDEQAALFTWAESNEAAHPELRNLFAIPNGAKVPYTRDSKGRAFSPQRVELVAEGLRRGVPDIMLAVMRRGNDGRTWGGLFVEMKRADHSNHATPEQQEWIARLRANGYMAVVAYGATEAQQCIMAYLQQDGAQ